MDFNAKIERQHSDSAAAGAQLDTYMGGPVSDHCEVESVQLNHRANGGANAAVDVKKVPSGTAIGSGVSVLLTAFDLTTGAATAQSRTKDAGTLTATLSDRRLAPGDSLALDYSGTLTALAGVGVTVVLTPIRRRR